MTWVALGVLVLAGFALMVLSWNGTVSGKPRPVMMIMQWLLICAAGIYLFLLAVKKAHRLWVTEERRRQQSEAIARRSAREEGSRTKDKKKLDPTASARKVLRRLDPESLPEDFAKALIDNLASELEIMSAVVYLRDKKIYRPLASYALVASEEPYSFREGEGLSGQAAESMQVRVLTQLPEAHREVYSGLGRAEPAYLAIAPFTKGGKSRMLVECTGYRHEPHDIENMFKILTRELSAKKPGK
jgi:hypothetical protein